MPSNLAKQIANRLGSPPDAVDQGLNDVVQRVRQQVGHYGYARIAGIGSFRMKEGQLTLEVDKTLAESVNYRYVGLEALTVDTQQAEPGYQKKEVFHAEEEVKPAPPKSELSEPEPIEPEPIELEPIELEPIEPEPIEAELPVPELIEPEPSEPEFISDDFWEEPSDQEKDHPLGPLPSKPIEEADYSFIGDLDQDDVIFEPPSFEGPSIDPESTMFFPDLQEDPGSELYPDEFPPEPTVRWTPPEEEPEAVAAAPPVGRDEDQPLPEQPGAEDEEEAIGQRKPVRERTQRPATPPKSQVPRGSVVVPNRRRRVQRGPNRFEQENKRSFLPWIIGFGIVIILAGSYWIYQNYFATPPPATPVTADNTMPSVADSLSQEAGMDSTITSGSPEDTTASQPPTEPPPTQQVDPSTPLRSSNGINIAQGGYTIVVSSKTSRNESTPVVVQYRTLGYRTGILEGRGGDDVMRYRIGVGQFSTIAEATAMRNTLAGNDLPNDAWVLRIR